MPYLAFDLEAKKLVYPAAKAAGVSVAEFGWGLLEMWSYVWQRKSSTIDEVGLDGCFGPGERTRTVLVSFGFLEPLEHGYRVRGTGRYLRIAEAQREAGKKAIRNLKQYREPAGSPPGVAGDDLRVEPAVTRPETRSDLPALTPSTEHRIKDSSVCIKPQTTTEASEKPGAELELAPSPKSKTRKQSAQQSFYKWAQDKRLEMLPAAVEDQRWSVPRINKTLGFVERHAGDLLSLAYVAFLEDPRKRSMNPPCPMYAFAADYPQYLSKLLREESNVAT